MPAEQRSVPLTGADTSTAVRAASASANARAAVGVRAARARTRRRPRARPRPGRASRRARPLAAARASSSSPYGMTARLVDALEVVDVEQHDRERPPARRAPRRARRRAPPGSAGGWAARSAGRGAPAPRGRAGAPRGAAAIASNSLGQLAQLVAAAPAEPGAEVAGARRRLAAARSRSSGPNSPRSRISVRTASTDIASSPNAISTRLLRSVERSLGWTHVVAERQLAAVAERVTSTSGSPSSPADRHGAAGPDAWIEADSSSGWVRISARRPAASRGPPLEARGSGREALRERIRGRRRRSSSPDVRLTTYTLRTAATTSGR